MKTNFTITKIGFNGNSIESKEIEEELSKLILINNINFVKLSMLILRKRGGNVVSILPRRLLIHLLSFLDSQFTSFYKRKFEETTKAEENGHVDKKNRFEEETKIEIK